MHSRPSALRCLGTRWILGLFVGSIVGLIVGSTEGCAKREGPLPLGASVEDCASCHTEQAQAFAGSAHARSDRSPVLEAMLPHVREAWGGAAADRCTRCHAPEHARLLGDRDAEVHVTCISCHAAVGNRGARDGLLLVDPSAPLGGPFEDAVPTPAHASRQAPLLASATLCGTCHELTGPALFIEETLTEHQQASAEEGDPRCISCHMPRLDDGAIALDTHTSRPRRSHAFVGLDPPWGASEEAQRQAANDATILLRNALSLSLVETDTGLELSVTNVGARHSVPTGVAFLRDVWVDVEIDDDTGTRQLSRVIELGDQPRRAGEAVALITDADEVEHRRLPFGQSRVVTLEVDGAATVRAHLRARAFREDTLTSLGLAHRFAEVPLLEVATAEH